MYNARQRILDGLHKNLELAAPSEQSLLLESFSDGQFVCLQSLATLLHVPGDALERFIGGSSSSFYLCVLAFREQPFCPVPGAGRGEWMGRTFNHLKVTQLYNPAGSSDILQESFCMSWEDLLSPEELYPRWGAPCLSRRAGGCSAGCAGRGLSRPPPPAAPGGGRALQRPRRARRGQGAGKERVRSGSAPGSRAGGTGHGEGLRPKWDFPGSWRHSHEVLA